MNNPYRTFALEKDRIGRLRLTGGWPDALQARMFIESLLGRVQISIPGLPAAAILIVDHYQDQDLATLAASAGRAPASASQVLRWEKSISSCLGRPHQHRW